MKCNVVIPQKLKYCHHLTHAILASLVAQLVKSFPANAGNARDRGSISGLGISSEEGNGNLLQYSCLKNSVDLEAWRAIVYGVSKSWI